MKSSTKKVLKIVLISLLVALALYVLVSFIVNKDGTMYWINYFVELLNKPLPIVGITTTAVLVFVWRLVISTNYGKAKLQEYDKKKEELEQSYEKFIENANSKMNELEKENVVLKGFIVKVCELSPNQKIKNYGKELLGYGKKTTNIETKE